MAYLALSIGLLLSCIAASRVIFPKPKVVESLKRHFLSEVFDLVKETKSRSAKVNIIQTNMCPGLAGLLKMNFDDELELDIDTIDVFYVPRRSKDYLLTLNKSSKMWACFTKSWPSSKARKNLKLRAMLESLEPREAELFLLAANKKLNLGIPKIVLKTCFSKIFKPRPRSSKWTN